jgi:hypothetical protein
MNRRGSSPRATMRQPHHCERRAHSLAVRLAAGSLVLRYF